MLILYNSLLSHHFPISSYKFIPCFKLQPKGHGLHEYPRGEVYWGWEFWAHVLPFFFPYRRMVFIIESPTFFLSFFEKHNSIFFFFCKDDIHYREIYFYHKKNLSLLLTVVLTLTEQKRLIIFSKFKVILILILSLKFKIFNFDPLYLFSMPSLVT